MFLSAALLLSCGNKQQEKTSEQASLDSLQKQMNIEIYDPQALTVIDSNATIEILAHGFRWSEGPLWLDELQSVIFSDVPANKIYQWNEKEGLSVYLEPSGYTGEDKDNPGGGSNGLILDHENHLILCQHGDRRVARMDADLNHPQAKFITIADNYQGKKFNSPNDLVMDRQGNIYFTDPPYGRPENKTGEIGFNGVFKVSTNNQVTLLLDSLSRPNGIGLSPDERFLYINQSDPQKPYLFRYEISEDGSLKNGEIFFDFSELAKTGKGFPDGLKVHPNGIIFATGPGGVHIISPQGKHLAAIRTVKATANCALDTQQKYLYLTITDLLLRVKLK